MKVNFFIVGQQKCGTTALHKFLSEHPQVKPGKYKEIDFFSCEGIYKKGFNNYHSLFSRNYFEKRFKNVKLLDSSPSYMASFFSPVKETVERLYNYNSNAHIIILLRNPIKRAFSAYMMYKNRYKEGKEGWWFDWCNSRGIDVSNVLKRGAESYNDFDSFINEELDAIHEGRNLECPVLKNSLYFESIKAYFSVFKNVIIVKNDELSNNTVKVMQRISSFLEIKDFDWGFLEEKRVFEGIYDEELTTETKKHLSAYFFNDINLIKEHYNIDLS